jgi:hypothetical protein
MSSTKLDGVRYFNCCICRNIFQGWGNNPDPVKNSENEYFSENDECCGGCNAMKVIPARLQEMTREAIK